MTRIRGKMQVGLSMDSNCESELVFHDREFQSWRAELLKAQLPMVVRQVDGLAQELIAKTIRHSLYSPAQSKKLVSTGDIMISRKIQCA